MWEHPCSPGMQEGITLFDDPANPNYPSVFHVRNDGWMGASLTNETPITIEASKPLKIKYALWIHAGKPAPSNIDAIARKISGA